MCDTFVFLYRSLLDSRIIKNAELLQLAIYCLLKAAYKTKWVNISTGRSVTEVKLMPGQLIFGRNKVAEKLGQKPTSVYKRLQKLKTLDFLNIQSDTHFSIISIRNWEKYQVREQAKEQPSDNQGTTKEQPSDTNNKDNNINNINKLKKENIIKEKNILFEHLWDKYPNKVGKLKAKQRFDKTVKKESDLLEIQVALENYIKHIETHNKNSNWIKSYQNGQTWFNQWKDWVNYDLDGDIISNKQEENYARSQQDKFEAFIARTGG